MEMASPHTCSLKALGVMGFPGGISGKEPACHCRRRKRRGFEPWMGKIPGQENGNPLNPLQYSCLENPMDTGAWAAIVYRGRKSQYDLVTE